LNKYLALFLASLVLIPFSNLAEENSRRQNQATLVVEYGLDSLERRYYHPTFHFDFPFRGGNVFSQVQYHSRMNGGLQGAIDYWVNVGVQKELRDKLTLELRLNHFCRHQTLRDLPYVWSLNEVLGRVILNRGSFTLALGGGGFIGGSAGYRQLVTAGAEWRGFFIPELSLCAELKLVNFSRLYHEIGFSLALNKTIDIFFKNTRYYEFRNTSYLGLRLHAGEENDAFLDTMKVLAGVSPFDREFKLEVEGDFKLEFFRNESRRVLLGVNFKTPILNGDGFFAQFWPAKMIYDLSLDYEKKFGSHLFAAWVSRYRADMPIDVKLPFTASLFTGLALRNQPDFDVLERTLRYEVAAGYDFKRGLEISGNLGLGIYTNRLFKVFAEVRAEADSGRIRGDLRLFGSFGRQVEIRPYCGWKKEISLDHAPDVPGKFLFGLGFFKKF
jgi:hypothetical protein